MYPELLKLHQTWEGCPVAQCGSNTGRGTRGCRSALVEDQTFHSKLHINMLSILAEEYLPFSKEIISLIEAQTAKVFIHPQPPIILIVLYLVSASSQVSLLSKEDS